MLPGPPPPCLASFRRHEPLAGLLPLLLCRPLDLRLVRPSVSASLIKMVGLLKTWTKLGLGTEVESSPDSE